VSGAYGAIHGAKIATRMNMVATTSPAIAIGRLRKRLSRRRRRRARPVSSIATDGST
jgi:hypothetical protein